MYCAVFRDGGLTVRFESKNKASVEAFVQGMIKEHRLKPDGKTFTRKGKVLEFNFDLKG